MSATEHPHIITPAETETIDVLGPTVEIVTPGGAEERAPCVIRGTIPPGGFVPLHSHVDPETFLVISGVAEGLTRWRPEPEWTRIAAGDVFYVPGDAPHAWRNRSDEPIVNLIVTTARIAEFFREVGTPARGNGHPEPPSAAAVARFDVHLPRSRTGGVRPPRDPSHPPRRIGGGRPLARGHHLRRVRGVRRRGGNPPPKATGTLPRRPSRLRRIWLQRPRAPGSRCWDRPAPSLIEGSRRNLIAQVKRALYYAAASLDGYIADPNDGLEWLLRYEGTYDAPDAEPDPMREGGGYERFYEGVGSLVSGSTTYEFVVDHFANETWPYAGKPYWVLSSRDLPVPEGDGVDVRIVDASVEEIYGDVVASAGDRAVWVVGGGNVASQFADSGLIEEVILTVVPVVLGDGKPLFDRPPGGSFELLGTRPSSNGMVELRYRLAGGLARGRSASPCALAARS